MTIRVVAVNSNFTMTWAARIVCGRRGVARSRFRMPPSRYIAIIVMNESTALSEIRIDVNTGRSTDANAGMLDDPYWARAPGSLLIITKTRTGIASVPITPSGSRTKILISREGKRQSPRRMVRTAVANRVGRDFEGYVPASPGVGTQ